MKIMKGDSEDCTFHAVLAQRNKHSVMACQISQLVVISPTRLKKGKVASFGKY